MCYLKKHFKIVKNMSYFKIQLVKTSFQIAVSVCLVLTIGNNTSKTIYKIVKCLTSDIILHPYKCSAGWLDLKEG